MKHPVFLLYGSIMVGSCNFPTPQSTVGPEDSLIQKDTIASVLPLGADSALDKRDSLSAAIAIDTIQSAPLQPGEAINVRNISPEEVIKFAETLVGTPYVYGSTDPKVGFDCSGFITYVFNHFKIKVPRSSIEFTNVGQTVPIDQAKRGDIILFTDPDFTNAENSDVGHMGLITSNEKGLLNFIHSTSGKAMSVTVTPMSDHYKKRFVRVGRIFPQNNG